MTDAVPDVFVASPAAKARCEKQLKRTPLAWKTITMDTVTQGHDKTAPGMFYDIEFPFTEAMLHEWGAEWLTKAFHAVGSLSLDNKVIRIITEEKIKVTTGNNAAKFLFEVEYEKPSPDLDTQMFVKVPYPAEGKTKTDRLSSSVNKQPAEYCEINTSRLLEGFMPMKIPKFYFGDISNDTSNWILITECIKYEFRELNYGAPGERLPPLPAFEIEGPYDKCIDAANFRGDSLEYYLLLVQKGAMLAGYHKSGKLLIDDETVGKHFRSSAGQKMSDFGMNPDASTGETEKAIDAKINMGLKFFETAKKLFPAYVTSDAFKKKFRRIILTANAYTWEIQAWKDASNKDYICLGHQNMNCDNAYFWRDENGKLDCGVLDWGMFSLSGVGQKLWWWLNCMDYEPLQADFDTILDCFIDTFHATGGPKLSTTVLKNQFIVSGMQQAIGLISAIPQINRMCKPDAWKTIKDRYDPRIALNIDDKSSLRLYLHCMNTVIRMIQEWDVDEALYKGFVQDFYVGQLKQKPKSADVVGCEMPKTHTKEIALSRQQQKELPPAFVRNVATPMMKNINPSTQLHMLTTATGGLLEYAKAMEMEAQRSDKAWRLVPPIPEKIYHIKTPGAYGERKISDKASAKVTSPYSSGTIAIDLGQHVSESLDIDASRGPKLLCMDGSTEFLLEPGRKWTSLQRGDQKLMAFQAAQRNRRMRPQMEAYLENVAKEKEAKEFLALADSDRRRIRCEKEQARTPVKWTPIGPDVVMKNHTKVSPGLIYGLEFPWNAEELEKMGPEWLTKAFHTVGTLESTNSVIKLTINERIKIDAGNNAGKFLFEVKYRYPRKDLHEKLFVKCPYKMTKETQSDRISSSVLKQPMDLIEINTYRLIEACIPKPTPKFYFGDISNTTSNYILITECIAYTGYDGVSQDASLKPFEIEGPYDKCMDWQLRGPAKDYYMLIVKAHAMIAGMDKSGKLCPENVKQTGLMFYTASKPQEFGCKLDGCSGEDPGLMKNKLKVAVTFFSETAKLLFPEYATTEAFKDKFTDTMMKWNAHKQEIVYFKAGYDADYCAFGHNNLNADNAYFWKNSSDELECGVIDWGGFGYGNLGHKIWWTFNCADYDNFKDNLDDYLDAFVSTYQENGGPKLDKEVLKVSFVLTCLENAAFMVAAVPNCYKQCPSEVWQEVKDRHDPRVAGNVDGKSTLRTTHHVLGNACRVLEEMKADEVLEKWVQDFYVGQMKGTPKTSAMIYGSPFG